MIPDVHWSIIPIGPLTIQVWGMFVAAGILAAMVFAKREATHQQLNANAIVDATFWIILAAMVGSRLFFVVTEWQLFTNSWFDVVRVWDGGMSITGGFIGAIVSGVLYFRNKHLSFWRYADIIVMYLPLGLAIGRLGCFFIFDHPGTVTNFILGEEYYLDNLVRHNHGLYLSLNGAILFSIFMFIKHKWKPRAPFYSMLFLLWYGIFRFIADFDRVADATYYGLTGAQYVAIAMVIGSLVLFGQRQVIRKKL